ncbi:hypothetical protein evm_003547 [Chilo suppressalis]|nr:hypothetical protein evm_003547 [Chilo suppressalis]
MKPRRENKSAVCEHALGGPNHYIRFDKPQIFATEQRFVPRMMREAIEIKKYPNFNREDDVKMLANDCEFCTNCKENNIPKRLVFDTTGTDSQDQHIKKGDPNLDDVVRMLRITGLSQDHIHDIRKSELNKSLAVLESWNGYKTPIEGTIRLTININEGKFEKLFCIAGGDSSVTILSQDTCVKLNLVKRVESCEKPHDYEKETLIKSNKDLFTGIGNIEKPYDIKLKKDSVPSSKTPYRVSLKIRPQLKSELDRLTKKVYEPSDWVYLKIRKPVRASSYFKFFRTKRPYFKWEGRFTNLSNSKASRCFQKNDSTRSGRNIIY